MSKKITCLICAVGILLSFSLLFNSCSDNTGEGNGESTEATTSFAPADSFAEYLVSDISELCIVYPGNASSEIYDAASALGNSIEEKFGVTLRLYSDYVNEDVEELREKEYEILVGECANREESEGFGEAIRERDFGYSLVGKKIVICGGDDANTVAAVNRFIEKIIKPCDTKDDAIFFSASMKYMTEEEYDIDSLKLGGVDIYEYTVVYPALSDKFEQVHARRLVDIIAEISGYRLKIKSDEAMLHNGGNEIRIGVTDRNRGIISELGLTDNQYYIGADGDGSLLVLGKDSNALIGAVDKIAVAIRNGGDNVALDFSSAIKEVGSAKELTVMSYNVLVSNWNETRYANVISDVLAQMPDCVGFQEVSGADHPSNWMQHLQDGLGQYYAWVGEQRGDGGQANKGEYSCIFYRKDLYTLKESATKWLSDTPDVISKYDSSGYYRVVTWAKLERKSDGKQFVCVNTHLAQEKDQIASTKQAKVLLSLINDKFKDIPIVLTGDFNCATGDAPYEIIAAELLDAKFNAPEAEPTVATNSGGRIIDLIFTNDKLYLLKHDVINDRKYQEGVTSDHYPVILKAIL